MNEFIMRLPEWIRIAVPVFLVLLWAVALFIAFEISTDGYILKRFPRFWKWLNK